MSFSFVQPGSWTPFLPRVHEFIPPNSRNVSDWIGCKSRRRTVAGVLTSCHFFIDSIVTTPHVDAGVFTFDIQSTQVVLFHPDPQRI